MFGYVRARVPLRENGEENDEKYNDEAICKSYIRFARGNILLRAMGKRHPLY